MIGEKNSASALKIPEEILDRKTNAITLPISILRFLKAKNKKEIAGNRKRNVG